MFYLLIGKLWIKKIGEKYDLFRLFTYGSIGYIILHFYLHMRTYTGILGMFKNLFYYILILDFVLTYCLLEQSQCQIEHYKDDENLCNDKERVEIIKKIKELNEDNKESVFVVKKEVKDIKEEETKPKVIVMSEKSCDENIPVYKGE